MKDLERWDEIIRERERKIIEKKEFAEKVFGEAVDEMLRGEKQIE